jgi:hypothetical protein
LIYWGVTCPANEINNFLAAQLKTILLFVQKPQGPARRNAFAPCDQVTSPRYANCDIADTASAEQIPLRAVAERRRQQFEYSF